MEFRSKIAWVLPGLIWLWLFGHLSWEWTLNSQYNYGWAVPFLGGLIFYFRWQRRPAPDFHRRGVGITRIGVAVGLLLLLPIRVIEEANPDWRLLGWILALCAVSFSLLSLYQAGGATWLKHFAFAVCFPLVAVPWPVQFENIVVQALMHAVAYVAVEIAGWFGVGAYQLGNVIQLRNGFVGVDEACSGVKTLQAGIMVALVLGELLQMRWSKRIALLVIGCGWVFLCNVFRATTLMFVAANQGLETLGRWHDFIGTAALLCGMAGMLALAWFWKGELERLPPRLTASAPGIAPPLLWSGLPVIWLALVFAGTEIWYRGHERNLIEQPPWQVRWEGDASRVALPIPESTRVILHYDEALSAAWENPTAVHWWAFFARWRPQRAALQLVRSHSPEICLPAIGRTFRGTRPDVKVSTLVTALDFRSYEFEQNGRPLFVFVCVQEDARSAVGPAETEWSLRGRLLAAWQGKRNLGQRLLEIAVLGLDDFSQAKEALAKTATEIVYSPKATD